MRGRIPKFIIELDEPAKVNLQALVRSQKTPVDLDRRARAMLQLAEGQPFLKREWALPFVSLLLMTAKTDQRLNQRHRRGGYFDHLTSISDLCSVLLHGIPIRMRLVASTALIA